jgi:hypothetical protein
MFILNHPMDDWEKLLTDSGASLSIQDRLPLRGCFLKFESRRYCLKEDSNRLTENKSKASG